MVGCGAALAEGFIQDHCPGGGDVEGADAATHGNAEKVVAGAADEVVEAGSFAAEDEDAVAGEVELVVIGGASFVEADDPDVLAFEFLKGTDEVDDARDAEVLSGASAGLDGYGAEGGGAAFGEDDAIVAGAVGYAEEGAEILWIFDTVEREEQAGARGGGCGRGEQVFDGEEFLRADDGDDALMAGCSRDLGQLVAGLLADANAGLAALGDQFFEAGVLALAGYDDVIKTPTAGLERLFDRVHAVENFHEG